MPSSGFLTLKEFHVVRVFAEEASVLEAWLSTTQLEYTTYNTHDKLQVLNELRNLEFDLLVSNGLSFLLPVSQLQRPHQLYLNVHPSLLPELRGLHPINGCYFLGHRFTGVTMHYMDDGMDSGNIIFQRRIRLTSDIEIGLLYQVLFEMEADVVEAGLKRLVRAKFRYPGKPQAASASEYKRSKEDMRIDFESMPSNEIIQRIRAFGWRTWGAHCQINGQKWRADSAGKS